MDGSDKLATNLQKYIDNEVSFIKNMIFDGLDLSKGHVIKVALYALDW